MVRKLSLGLWRRWSKASRDGSLSENIEKADIRASAKGISTSPDRGSGREAKRERRDPKRASAERSFRASPGASAMASHSIGPSGKIGNSGKHYAQEVCEMRDQNKRVFRAKIASRELLFHDQSHALERSHLIGSPNRRPPDFGVSPKPRLAKSFRKRAENRPDAQPATEAWSVRRRAPGGKERVRAGPDPAGRNDPRPATGRERQWPRAWSRSGRESPTGLPAGRARS